MQSVLSTELTLKTHVIRKGAFHFRIYDRASPGQDILFENA